MRWQLIRFRWWRTRQVERLQMWLARRLPSWLVYQASIRLIAHATTGQYDTTVVPELAAMDALKRWEHT